MTETRKLRVFLCHSSQDKSIVRELYQRLNAEGWIDSWLDEEKLLPGQDFHLEINKATRDADVIIICLSKASVIKDGYVNREIRRALDIAQEKVEGAIYIVPVRLDECDPSFEQLKKLQWVDYFKDDGYVKLRKSLLNRFENLEGVTNSSSDLPDDLYKFIYFPSGGLPETRQISRYPFWISKYPVTNFQYKRFLSSVHYNPRNSSFKGVAPWDNHNYWRDFPVFDRSHEESKRTDLNSGDFGMEWFEEKVKLQDYPAFPRYWDDPNFGVARMNAPIVGVTWYEASAYCKWLEKNWNEVDESRFNIEITWPSQIWMRLPTRNEWELAAGGKYPEDRFSWDKPNEITHDIRKIFSCANVAYQIGKTTPVNKYPEGASPRGVMDMSGNVWEWLSNIFQAGIRINDFTEIDLATFEVKQSEFTSESMMEMIGGAWSRPENDAKLAGKNIASPNEVSNDIGFRVVIAKM